MARARNIKPGFFKNEILGEADPIYSLLFAGLWTIADKEGRLEHRPKRIKAEVFPYRFDVDPCLALAWLEHESFITVYEVDNKKYIQINNWKKHQSPHHKEVESVIPPATERRLPELKQEDIHACAKHESSMDYAQLNEVASSPLIPDSLNSDSLNSDSLNSDSLQDTIRTSPSEAPEREDGKVVQINQTPYQKIVELYHRKLPELREVAKLTEARKSQVRARWRNELDSLEEWEDYFDIVSQSRFLMGRAPPTPPRTKPFEADFDWLIKVGNVIKVCEGKYLESG